ncbi:MAG: RNA methyltransferase [Candidatus Cybelea sp.]
MATRLGTRAVRLAAVRALRTHKGRREQGRFAFEGATLLAEAVAAEFPIAEIYATQAAYDSVALLRELDAGETPVFLLEPASAASISDVVTPSGIVAVGPTRLRGAAELVGEGGPLLVLADVGDPANAGTLLRSADAFGCTRVLLGRLGVDPYHPKLVRGSMGAIFRLSLGVADPHEFGQVAAAAGLRVLGLASGGAPLTREGLRPPFALVVGNERHGLGAWQALCERVIAIPMTGPAESLSAAVAGSIALYEASRNAP